jgi:hypothetical protein
MKKKISENTVNKTIDEAIVELVKGDYKQAKLAIEELAHLYKSAGQTKETFIELCTYVENEAVKRTGNEFIRTRFGLSMRDRAAN